MVTIRDVAKKTGVSIATVSRILNKKGNYTEATENIVYKAVKELGYAVNLTAKSLKTGLTFTIGIAINDFYLLHYPELIKTTIKVLNSHDFSSEIILNKNLNACINLLKNSKLDGLLIIDPGKDEVPLKRLIEISKNFVIFNGDIAREDVNLVEIDYFQGGYEATKYLLSLKHKDILFIEDNISTNISKEIKRGYLYALDENGIQFKEQLLISGNFSDLNPSESIGYDIVNRMVKNIVFTAIITTEDRIAYGAIKAIKDNGLRIPEDISVIGFGDLASSKYFPPPLTTVKTPISEMGELGTEILVNNIRRKDNIIKRVKLKVNLIKRNTTTKRLT